MYLHHQSVINHIAVMSDGNNDTLTISSSKNESLPYLTFQIGFDKCGTTSLFKFCKSNIIKSRHWMHHQIRSEISDNYLTKKPVLKDSISNGVKYFGDFTVYLFNDSPIVQNIS